MGKATIITIILLVVLNIIGWWLFLSERAKPVEVITETEVRWDTCYFDRPVPVFTKLVDYKFFDFPVETITYVGDSTQVQIELPIEKKTYQDSTYKLEIQGFQPNLNYIEVYNKTIENTNTVVKYKRPIISIGPSVSFGWNPITKQPDMSIGASIIIPIWS